MAVIVQWLVLLVVAETTQYCYVTCYLTLRVRLRNRGLYYK